MPSTSYTLDADVLVLGGGSAGAMAAIWAKQQDPSQKVVVFEKGDLKYSGCIARGMDALNIVAVPGVSTPQEYIDSIHQTCDGVVDDGPSYAMVCRSWELVQTLKDWGVYFPQDEGGNYEVLKVHPKGRFALTMIEPELKTKLAARVLASGCTVVNRVMAAELLLDEGRVAGAIGLNVRTGETVVCRAKATIVTAGGAARFGLPSSGYLYGVYDYPGNTGDGYVLAYRAGAALTGFEHTTRYCIVKDVNIPLLYIVLTRGARVFDAFEEDITSSDISINALVRRHEAGRGPVHIRLSHLPEAKIKAIEEILFEVERPVQERFHQGRGVNFRRQDIELWPTDYFLCGGHGMSGVRVNERAETTVPGLYAAGDNACVPRGHLSGAFVFGQIAAESASAYAKQVSPPRLNEGQVAAFAAKLAEIGARRGRVSVDECEHKLRRMINDYAVPPKNELKLAEGQKWLGRIEEDLKCRVQVGSVRDAFKVLEVENILGCAAVSLAASRERKESRWGTWHYRADYPEKDDANWAKHILCRRGDADRDVRISHKPVERLA
ncbi:MAG: FAD-binding protein [Chloroflexi bacterium]|nr:FAD-binding protein [Chloroflexota bacterium]